MTETLTHTPEQPSPDIPKSMELFRGDINDSVIRVQQSTGVEITPDWWTANVGNDGSTESILQRFDDAYEQTMLELQPVSDETNEHETMEVMNVEAQREEAAWQSYRPIGSPEYEQTNQERIADGRIKTVKIGSSEHPITLVASVKLDPETGKPISGHENRPEAESMTDTEQAFTDYIASTPPEHRAVIYEGDERVFADRNEAITKAADSGLVQHLASKERVPMVSGEPTDAETLAVMEQLGVSREEVLALYVARGLEGQLSGDEADFLVGYINHQAASLGIEGFHDYSEDEKQAIVKENRLDEVKAELTTKVSEVLPTINNLYRESLGKDLFVVENGDIVVNPDFDKGTITDLVLDKLGWSGSGRLNEVSRLSMEMRDRVIFHRIVEAYNGGKNPFVVYGGSHIVTLEPALKNYADIAA